MALNQLDTETMIDITSTWVADDHPHRDALASVPVLAALLPEVEEAHAELVETHPGEPSTERILAIMHTQKRLDDRHDNVLRTIWYRLLAESHYSSDAQDSQALHRLRTKLLPEGLDATQKAYRDEAEQATRMAERLSSTDRALLASISVGRDATLLDAIDEWISLAAQIGELQTERCRSFEGTGASSAECLAARNQWLRTIHAVRTVAGLVVDSQPIIGEMMQELEAEERHAAKRTTDEHSTRTAFAHQVLMSSSDSLLTH